MIPVETPNVRSTDPETSHQAAQRMTESGKRISNQRLLWIAVTQEPGRTAAELGEVTGLGQHEASRRLAELNGVMVQRGEPRKCRMFERQALEIFTECANSGLPFRDSLSAILLSGFQWGVEASRECG